MELISNQSKASFFGFASLYGLVSTFFLANFYSWALNGSFQTVLLSVIFLAPFFGVASFLLNAFLLKQVGGVLGGNASFSQLCDAVAWSKVPYVVSLTMWAILVCVQGDMAFINYASSSSSVVIILVSMVINISAFVRLVRSIKLLQSFSSVRAFFNALISVFLIALVSLVIMFLGRYIYILIS